MKGFMSSAAAVLALVALVLSIGYALGVASATEVIGGCKQPAGSPADLIAGISQ
jgi:hypothetical protein